MSQYLISISGKDWLFKDTQGYYKQLIVTLKLFVLLLRDYTVFLKKKIY